MTGSIDIMLTGFDARKYRAYCIPESVSMSNTKLREILTTEIKIKDQIYKLTDYFTPQQKAKFEEGYGDIGIVNIEEFIMMEFYKDGYVSGFASLSQSDDLEELFDFMREEEIYNIIIS
jgi:hypothetical protein